jgi:transcriptional regulator with XRE-family HTH domain
MGTRHRRTDQGRAQATLIRRRIGDGIRSARRGSGISLRAAASAVGLSHSHLGRIERAELPNVSVLQLSLACAAVGLEFRASAYPAADPVRDRAQLRLMERLRWALPPSCRLATEVPLPIPGDRRAHDGVITLRRGRIAFEAETRLDDLQALVRRLLLKQRDSGCEVLVMVVSDTRHNRHVLELHRQDLRAAFPLDARSVMQAVRRGDLPGGNGIVVL